MILRMYSLVSIGVGAFWAIILGLLLQLSLKSSITIGILGSIITFGILCFISTSNEWNEK